MARSKQNKSCFKRVSIGVLAALLSVGVAKSFAEDKEVKGMQSIQFRKVIDLSHVISTTIPLWPNDPPVTFDVVASQEKDGYYLRRFSIGEHSATHMNAPNSFHPNAIGIDAYKPESLVRPAVVIDIRTQARDNPDYVIGVQDIEKWEQANGRIAQGSVVLFYTGWQALWNDPKRFINEDAKGPHFPGVGAATTQFLLEERQIAGVGIDTHGADPGQDTVYATNSQILAKDGIVLECLTNLDQLPAKGTTLVIGVLRLKEGSGSPVSVMAFVP
ncbi:cyclase family protein [Pseudomonas sp. FW305-67]|jgi:kynurenine formamidase|nr:cyclase family protein [Pseudomonas sp. PDM08]PMY48406.1 cyclase family protein [Pseudomonas sp. FW305-53]PMY83385.1 cyclase family protein [Pseudomonas sp. FW303-C2]PMY89850.1 cyclase family protein [Pseudomonas sp. FW305-62]PNA44543.1 cyclase family protein [Pseudomonas sp. FW306-2-2C-A10BC]PNA82480.1 cyclase family protein [Pseudomonas sp. MPR-R3B]PNB11925.1 cyclase family protein [Pseudomonas sp. FW305-67]